MTQNPARRDPHDGKPVLSFTLIHGTFARDAEWVHDDHDPALFRSRLRAELGEGFDVRFEKVAWGGKGFFSKYWDNTESRRMRGVRMLRQHLAGCPDLSDDHSHYLVAHSHGGGIAAHALRDPEAVKKVTGVVCLSSPFLSYGESAFRRDLLFFSSVILILYAVQLQSLLLWLYTAFVVLLTALLLVTGNFGETEESKDRIVQRLRELALRRPQEQPDRAHSLEFLALRARRDEVGLLFWFTKKTGAGFRRLWQVVNRFGGWTLGAFFLGSWAAAGLLKASPDAAWKDSFESARSWLDHWVLTPMMLVATLLLVVMTLMRLSYAFDSAKWLARLDVSPKDVPWDGARKKVFRTRGWFKHSSIQNQSPPLIAAWIRGLRRRAAWRHGKG